MALTLGLVLSSILVGLVLVMEQFVKLSGQSRDGKIALRAAQSGVEDGLLRLSFARAKGLEDELFSGGLIGPVVISDENRPPQASYTLEFKMDSLASGDPGVVTTTDPEPKDLHDPKKAKRTQVDDVLDFNLSYLTKNLGLTRIEIYYSDPYYEHEVSFAEKPLVNYFTAFNYRLLNRSESGEEQLVAEETNTDPSRRFLQVKNLDKCLLVNSECHLRIKSQVALRYDFSFDKRRIVSGGWGANRKGKRVYVAIGAWAPGDVPILPSSDPGAISIISVGYAGEAQRKLEARIDAATGRYLGLFDYGVYCGDKCEGL